MIVRRPSPNIREFVVRRAEPTRSLSDGSLLFGSDVLTLAFGAVPVAAMAWALFQSNPGQSFTLKLEHILVVALFLAFLYIKLNAVTEESLLVIKDLGIQVKTCYASGFSRTEFIPIRDVVNLVINEAVTLFQVRFYLAVVAARRTELVVVFPSLLPRSDELKVVYWETQKVLWANQYY
ncbi:GPI-GlcNAc transferase complex, PIG-H component-domain-containing protein [Zopfochytrium polystomum]|nr:GPI-GlcNAc transferase complex, PIG-H component-domain-containing protein [Zopfochytrium polystomum]